MKQPITFTKFLSEKLDEGIAKTEKNLDNLSAGVFDTKTGRFFLSAGLLLAGFVIMAILAAIQ